MKEQKEKQNKTTGYLLIALSLAGIILRILTTTNWNTSSYIKLTFPIAILGLGLWRVLKKEE